MRILIIAPHDVSRPVWGGAIRIFHLAQGLAEHAAVTLLHSGYLAPEFRDVPVRRRPTGVTVMACGGGRRYSQVFNPGLTARGARLARRGGYDVVIGAFPWSCPQAWPVSLLAGVPLVLDEQNVEFERFAQTGKGNRPARRLLEAGEGFFCRRARLVFCVSEEDRSGLIRSFGLDPGRVAVVPNGVDTGAFRPDPAAGAQARAELGLEGADKVILFVGNMRAYRPNWEAVQDIRSEIAPRLEGTGRDVRYLVVGGEPPEPFCDRRFIFPGVVKDMAGYYNAADVVITPLRSGGGTRLKAIEALACGRRVVSTGKGAEGIPRCPALSVADDWDGFCARVVENWDYASDAGAVDFARGYGWESVTADAYQRLERIARR